MGRSTLNALHRLRRSGRSLILVTGRRLEDLLAVFAEVDVFNRVVAENGAVLYDPQTRRTRILGTKPPPAFIETLRKRGVLPLAEGAVIVATGEPHEVAVLETIKEQGLELQVIFNKGAVMVLPAGVNKQTGLAAALEELSLSPHNVVGVGDAENDHAFLSSCELGVAVANALPALKQRAGWVTAGAEGAGVRELVAELLRDDLADIAAHLGDAALSIGRCSDGTQLTVAVNGSVVLIIGPSAGGKSRLARRFIEALSASGYQFCLVDPEGDYPELEGSVVLGDAHAAPSAQEVLDALGKPGLNIVIDLLGLQMEDRPPFAQALFQRLAELGQDTGRPHWVIADEAHHLFPEGSPLGIAAGSPPFSLLLVTVHPERIHRDLASQVSLVLAVGPDPYASLADFATAHNMELKRGEAGHDDRALAWRPKSGIPPAPFQPDIAEAEHRRHLRKYADGDLGRSSFFFRGPNNSLNLRAQNLHLFNQLAEGVDDETWLFHLRRSDYSNWFRKSVKDDGLADEVVALEQTDLSARQSRHEIRRSIEARYVPE